MNGAEHAAIRAADGIQDLNRLTIDLRGYEWPGEVDGVIGSLESVAHRMNQALSQAFRWLERSHELGLIRHDENGPVDAIVSDALGDLERARREAHELAVTLSSVRDSTFHMGGLS